MKLTVEKPDQNQKLLLVILTISTLFLLFACNKPILQQVDTSVTPTPVNPEGAELPEFAGEAPIEFTPAALQPTSEDQPTLPASQPGSNCGRSDVTTIMVLGIDDHAQADGIRLVRVDFKNSTVHMTSIPRDFYVPLVGFEPFGLRLGRINATFGYAEYYYGKGTGAKAVAENLTHNFGVEIDDQFVLYYTEIGKYIDAVGGITVTLDEPAEDYSHYFPAGTHQMDGETAVAFMRIRFFDSDISRIDRQTIVMGAILDKVREGISAKMILDIFNALLADKTTQTDLGLKDMYSYYCLSKSVNKSDIHMTPIPFSMFHFYTTEAGAQVLIPHAEVVEFIQESLGIIQ